MVPFFCDGIPCWLILTESLGNWEWRTYDYVCSLLLDLIK